MLIQFDSTRPLYVVGKCATAEGIVNFIENEAQVENISVEEYHALPSGSQCMLGFNNMLYRNQFFAKTNIEQHQWPSYVHPNAVVVSPEHIGRGCIVWPCTFLGHLVSMPEFCVISQMSSIGKDVVFGRNCVVTPGVIIGGSTAIGDNVYFGQATSIKDKIKIGHDVMFMMNSVVSKDVSRPGRYYGNRRT